MSYDAIKKAALELFATQGYEGTSLSQIADKVGIKKQSIYSHFKNKDELYLQLVEETFDIELRRIRHSLELKAKQPLYDCLLDALSSYMEQVSLQHLQVLPSIEVRQLNTAIVSISPH